MIKAVIFDIDGTLVDSVDLHAQAWQEAFRHFGKEIPFAAIRKQIGKGSDKLIPTFLSEEEVHRFGEDLDSYRGELFRRKYLPKVVAFPAVRELFLQLRRDGKRIALASSSKKEDLEVYKRIAKIADLVEEQTSSADADESKPAPDILQAALAKLGDPAPDTVIMVGDTPYDATAAKRAGLRSIGVLCGGFPEDELREAGCIEIYRDPADLLVNYWSSVISAGERRAA